MAGKNASPLAYKPTKMLVEWLTGNKVAAMKAARANMAIMAIYGNVMLAIEIDCAAHCACNRDYNGENFLNVQNAIDFYMDKLFNE